MNAQAPGVPARLTGLGLGHPDWPSGSQSEGGNHNGAVRGGPERLSGMIRVTQLAAD